MVTTAIVIVVITASLFFGILSLAGLLNRRS
ncbi:MAG: hypothetical protein HW378_5084 [Anaerolineales bacterium]|nr:hypothetical protein [Anaerolineales bacterium]